MLTGHGYRPSTVSVSRVRYRFLSADSPETRWRNRTTEVRARRSAYTWQNTTTFGMPAVNLSLGAGSVGENITLASISEDEVCVGDHVRLGTAVVEVSGPRVPCGNLARRIGRPDWVKQTIRENRTGFYLRVLEPGMVQAGDPWELQERRNETGSIAAINRCMYLDFDAGFARAMLEMPGLEEWWKDQARQKLTSREPHWTSTMKDEG